MTRRQQLGSTRKRHAEARVAIGRVWPKDIEQPGAEGDALRAKLAKKIEEIGNAENESRGIEIGYSYAGSAITCNSAGDEYQDDPLRYIPTTTPGYRPPAVYLEDDTPIFSLFGPGFTLLQFAPDEIEAEAFASEAASIGLPLAIRPIGDRHAQSIYSHNLILLRPDQHVAWRGQDVPSNLIEILKKVSGN